MAWYDMMKQMFFYHIPATSLPFLSFLSFHSFIHSALPSLLRSKFPLLYCMYTSAPSSLPFSGNSSTVVVAISPVSRRLPLVTFGLQLNEVMNGLRYVLLCYVMLRNPKISENKRLTYDIHQSINTHTQQA